MSFSELNGLTEAGSSFVLGYMAQQDPGLAEQAIAALRDHAGDTSLPPEYWIKEL